MSAPDADHGPPRLPFAPPSGAGPARAPSSASADGELARKVEEQTAIAGRKQAARFVGQWVPTLVAIGIYNKLVKVIGSERSDFSPPIGVH